MEINPARRENQIRTPEYLFRDTSNSLNDMKRNIITHAVHISVILSRNPSPGYYDNRVIYN